MFNILKNKKGWWPWAIIIGLVIAFLSAGVIWMAVSNYAGKAEVKTQVELCRTSNEIRLGMKELTGSLAPSTPRVCITIDKTKDTKSAIPTKNYPQNKEGAKAEIRDMIKDCWYMWLEGKEVNAFDGLNIIGRDGCHVCYMFKLKDKSYLSEGISIEDIRESMSKPYFAEDGSDTCAFQGGFFEDVECGNGNYNLGDPNGWREVPSKKAVSKGKKCCIRKEVPNTCENKGGKCYTEEEFDDRDVSLGFNNIYLKWYCPKTKQKCYVKEEEIYTYTRYVTESERGGNVYFIISANVVGGVESVGYAPGDVFAISFISPTKEICWTDGGVKNCVGVLSAALRGGGATAGILGGAAVLAVGGALAIGVAVSWPVVVVGGALILGTAALGLDSVGWLDEVFEWIFNWGTDPMSVDVPSNIFISSLEHALDPLGCSVV